MFMRDQSGNTPLRTQDRGCYVPAHTALPCALATLTPSQS
jgi:hypothetical protein